MRILLLLVVVAVVAVVIFVRFVPAKPGAYFALPSTDGVGDMTGPRSFTAVRQVQTTPDGVLRAFDTVALGTPRTRLVEGSVAKERLVYVTRTLVWGFPDYTTVGFEDGLLVVHARARFGGADLGVNQARIEGWLAQLGPLIAPLP